MNEIQLFILKGFALAFDGVMMFRHAENNNTSKTIAFGVMIFASF